MKTLRVNDAQYVWGDLFPCMELAPEIKALASVEMDFDTNVTMSPDERMRHEDDLLCRIDGLLGENAACPRREVVDLLLYTTFHSL